MEYDIENHHLLDIQFLGGEGEDDEVKTNEKEEKTASEYAREATQRQAAMNAIR